MGKCVSQCSFAFVLSISKVNKISKRHFKEVSLPRKSVNISICEYFDAIIEGFFLISLWMWRIEALFSRGWFGVFSPFIQLPIDYLLNTFLPWRCKRVHFIAMRVWYCTWKKQQRFFTSINSNGAINFLSTLGTLRKK